MKKFFAVFIGILILSAAASVGFAADDDLVINPVVEYKTASADIVFFIDRSGSMQDDINKVKANVKEFAKYLTDRKVDVRFAIIDFCDNYSNGYGSGIEHFIRIHSFENGSYWTTSSQGVYDALDTISAGGDESITLALSQVFNWNDRAISAFRPQAYHFGFLLTDEPTVRSRYFNETYITLQQVIDSYKRIPLELSVIARLNDKEHYRNLFTETGGVFIDIDREDYAKSMLDIAQWIFEIVTYPEVTPHTTIEVVPHTITENTALMDSIAGAAGITRDQINILTEENYAYYDISLPHEPSEDMKISADAEFITKIDTINLYTGTIPTEETYAYFMFNLHLNISDDVIGSGLTVRNSATFNKPVNGYIDFIMFDENGNKVSTITQNTENVIILMYGQVETCLTLYLVQSNADNGAVRLWSADAGGFLYLKADERKSFIENVKDRVRETVNDLLNWINGGSSDGSSGGCDSGMGIAAVIALAGMFCRKKH